MSLTANLSQSYGALPAMWDHTQLPTTWCRWAALP